MAEISFDGIPVDVRVPGQYVEIDSSQAVRGLPGIPSRILVVGQRLAAGGVAAEIPTRVLDARQADGFFGVGSQLSRMFAALKANNPYTETWAIALDDDGAGVAATGSVKFGGTVTGAGTVNLYLAGRRIRVAVAVAEASADTAANMAAAINANARLPITAAVDGVDDTKVNLTARNKGENGNYLDIRMNYYAGEVMPAGMTATIVAMSGGSGNPDIAGAIAAMGDTWYTDLAMPWTDASNLAALETELYARFGPMTAKDCFAYAAATRSHANLVTLGNSRNCPHLSILGNTGSPTPPEEWAAAYAGLAAYYTKIDPARPLQTLPLVGILPPSEADVFTATERNLLLHDGIATFKVDDGGRVLMERAVTTYETDAYSIDDIAYLDLMTLKTVTYLRYAVRAHIARRFPRHKLANDGTRISAGQKVATPKAIQAELVALFRELEASGLVEDLDQFKTDLLVVRNGDDPNRIDALIPPNLVNQLRVFAGKIQFLL